MIGLRAAYVTIVVAGVLAIAGCPADSVVHQPERKCADACEARAKARCSDEACSRGCAFILDRILENEHLAVIDCVAKRTGASATRDGDPKDEWRDAKCGDREWAECAARIGVHADGGPPAPPPVDEHPTD